MGISTANVVVIVMDETCVELHPHGQKGNVVLLQNADRNAVSENLPLSKTKENITLIGTVCNDPDLQQYLPQFLLPKGHKDKDADTYTSIWPTTGMPAPPPNVVVWRDTSGWTTIVTMKRYMKAMKAAIHRLRPGAVIVLAMDALPAHMAKDVLRYSARFFGHAVIIPGQLGWLLDILDTKVYSDFKNNLNAKVSAGRIASETGVINKAAFAEILFDCIRLAFV